jgi:hypothetical protein
VLVLSEAVLVILIASRNGQFEQIDYEHDHDSGLLGQIRVQGCS